MKKKKAFTLAEVLITLGVIGVVAAMTMGTVSLKFEKMQTAVKLKKFYNIMTQATNQAILEHGDWRYWDYSLTGENFYKRYYKNHLPILSEKVANGGRTVHIKLKDGTCAYFNYNTSSRVSIANFYWGINTTCGKGDTRQGRQVFELALFNFKYMKHRCNYTPTLCGFPGDGAYQGDLPEYADRGHDKGSCSDRRCFGVWQAYNCYYKFIQDGMQFSKDYYFDKKG